ncbi:MAG: AbrB family transcriptional regulator [Omnitrophica bacterium GWA2_52_12]|nr:MAG: AbrB family transcriptional regulator [Omnitrophica bacterium GWA2_52_12]
MIKTLTAHGNSSALVIEKAVLELLNIDTNTPLEVTTDGRNLIISPVRSGKAEKRIHAALQKVNRIHGKTLKRLGQ